MPKSKSLKKTRVISSRESYRGPVFWVTTDNVLEPTGVRVRRDVVRHSGSVVVLAVDESSSGPRVLLEKQYRHAAGRFLLELPAGRIDEGENELKAAKRELLEETGYSARSWKRILRFWASPGFVAEAMSLYLARDLTQAKPRETAALAHQYQSGFQHRLARALLAFAARFRRLMLLLMTRPPPAPAHLPSPNMKTTVNSIQRILFHCFTNI